MLRISSNRWHVRYLVQYAAVPVEDPTYHLKLEALTMKIFETHLCDTKYAGLAIGNAIFWAAAMFFVPGLFVVGNSWTIVGLLVACWFAVHTQIPRPKLNV